MKPYSLGVLLGKPTYSVAVRPAVLGVPSAPAAAESLGQRAENGKRLEHLALLSPVLVERRIACSAPSCPEPLQRIELEPKDLVAVDPPSAVQFSPVGRHV